MLVIGPLGLAARSLLTTEVQPRVLFLKVDPLLCASPLQEARERAGGGHQEALGREREAQTTDALGEGCVGGGEMLDQVPHAARHIPS